MPTLKPILTNHCRASTVQGVLQNLRRHTSSGLYIPELDGLRFTAIFAVVVYHIAGDILRHSPPWHVLPTSFLFKLTQQLNIGVPLFFAISGMVLGLPFAKYWLQSLSRVSLKRYFLRRLTRLEPPYIVALLLAFLLKLLGHRNSIANLVPHLGASLLYLHNAIYGQPSSINFVAWSLEIEVQFYILAPLLACIFAVRPSWLRRSLLAIAIVTATAFSLFHPNVISRLSLLGNIQYFLTGFVVAEAFLLFPATPDKRWRWDLVSVFGWPVFLLLIAERPLIAYTTLPAIILLLYIAAFCGRVSSSIFSNLWTTTIGGMCYSIYLLHNYIIAIVGFVSERVGQNQRFEIRVAIQIALMSPIVLAISIVYYYLVEQPCMKPDWPAHLKRWLLREQFDSTPAKAQGNCA